MQSRLTHNDVSNAVDVESPAEVGRTVRALFESTYPGVSFEVLDQLFLDLGRLFGGRMWGYQQCDTPYHDLRHTLDVTLAMARLVEGHERVHAGEARLGPERALVGVVTAALHDAGYLRANEDRRVHHGAEYTRIHVSRGAEMIARYLQGIGLGHRSAVARRLVHYTGIEIPIERLGIESEADRRIGQMLGSADLIAQMSDRLYLEKCRDFLYPELVLAGIASEPLDGDPGRPRYRGPEDLLAQTPEFHEKVAKRKLAEAFGGVTDYARIHFGGRNLYLEEVEAHMRYLRRLVERGDFGDLRRQSRTLSAWTPAALAEREAA